MSALNSAGAPCPPSLRYQPTLRWKKGIWVTPVLGGTEQARVGGKKNVFALELAGSPLPPGLSGSSPQTAAGPHRQQAVGAGETPSRFCPPPCLHPQKPQRDRC